MRKGNFNYYINFATAWSTYIISSLKFNIPYLALWKILFT